MPLDTVTLALVSLPVFGVLGVLLLYAWNQDRSVEALAWWAASLGVAGLGVTLVLIGGIVPLWVSVTAGNAATLLGLALFWSGLRIFEGRRAHLPSAFAGPALWLLACSIPAFYKAAELRVAVLALVGAGYTLASVRELWRGRPEALGARDPLLFVLGGHAAFTLGRLVVPDGGVRPPTQAALALQAYELIVFAIAAAFLVINLVKERIEAEQRSVASCDALTGTLSRRAFLDRGRSLLDRARRRGRPCVLIVADIDHLGGVNDRFGRAAGDEVLSGVARIASQILPRGALLARLGGGGFGILLAAAPALAQDLAERLRASLEGTRFETDREAFGATVSVGLAATEDLGHILDALIAAAEVALHQAKSGGRNRVEATSDPEVEAGLTAYDELALA